MPDDGTMRALAEFIHHLRRTWDRPGIHAAIHARCATESIATVAHIAVDAAMDSTARTPAVIVSRDRRWVQPPMDGSHPVPPPPDTTLRRQPDQVASRGAAAARAAMASAQHPPSPDGAP